MTSDSISSKILHSLDSFVCGYHLQLNADYLSTWPSELENLIFFVNGYHKSTISPPFRILQVYVRSSVLHATF